MSDSPLVSHIYTADPSAHVFNDRIYVYPSHDRDTGISDNDSGDQYDMVDYHVFSMDDVGSEVTDHGVALKLEDIPWAEKQLWAPDAAQRNGKYYLFFPARAQDGLFRIGVAVGDKPEGPFVAEPDPIAGSYSIDPAVLVDGADAFLYFGGLWGGQLQHFDGNRHNPALEEPTGDSPAINPRVARLSDDMKSIVGEVQEMEILDENGQPLRADDHDRRFFEAAWVHKRGDTYYLSYSTGNTHYLVYATSKSPTGPFTYGGRILEPVVGWTTHQSIVEHRGRWFLFHHDSSLSGGKNALRCMKAKEIFYDEAGRILPVEV
ncbi:glycoside hydrolase family 43 protein [Opitutaceae bacterium]|nr:glycoside hydrolase family 43 protein [Opitutaceae bacterium]